MNTLLPLTIILTGITYFIYQIYQSKQIKTPKPKSITRQCLECGQTCQIKRTTFKPLSLAWKDQICFKIFGKKTWIRYRQGYTRARYAVNYFYPTCGISCYSLFSVLSKLLTKTIWKVP